jgi:hypothetical protein
VPATRPVGDYEGLIERFAARRSSLPAIPREAEEQQGPGDKRYIWKIGSRDDYAAEDNGVGRGGIGIENSQIAVWAQRRRRADASEVYAVAQGDQIQRIGPADGIVAEQQQILCAWDGERDFVRN